MSHRTVGGHCGELYVRDIRDMTYEGDEGGRGKTIFRESVRVDGSPFDPIQKKKK